ncbi:MAG: zinc-dependent metalloprotease [Phycisphaerae bacterium]
MRSNRLISGLAVGLCAACVWAQEAPDSGGQDNLAIAEMMAAMSGGMKMPGAEGKSGLPDFKKVTKDMDKKEGLFTLWSYPKGAKGKDSEKLLCQIPSGLLGEKFMLSTSVSGGGFFTGFPLDERVVQWELLNKQLLLVEPQAGYIAKKGKEVSDVVRRTYPDRIRVAVPLVTRSPGGDPVIDLGKLLKSSFADIGWMTGSFGPFGGFGGGGSINAGLSKWTKKKSFPQNVEIGVELAVGRSNPPGSYDKKMIHYSFWSLPKSDYTPRVADDRVGYFITTNQDWAKPTDSREIFNRYIDRWHLVKRDASLALCEPKQPIIYYIEKTVPVRFRAAVRDGILDWNKAFEKVGFLNAVEVRQQTDDNEWKDLDPEDMRYSFFRWIVTGAGFAMGPHRANPFTGQIYDADIIFDDSMVRHYEQSARRYLPSAIAEAKFADPALEAFLERFPQWRRPTRDWERFDMDDHAERQALRAVMRHRMALRGSHCCEYAEGMKHQVQLGHAMLAGKSREVTDRFLHDVIKEVVAHEVGHTLGLRHNFKASSIWTVKELKERMADGRATTGSVMDYNPVLFFKDQPEGHFITPTIGPYDFWAIEYGYRPFDSSYKPEGDKKDGDDKKDEGEDKAKLAEASKTDEGANAGNGHQVKLDDIPAEVLDKLPPEVKEMIASGKMASMMQSAPAMPGMPDKKPSGSSFKAPPSGEAGMLLKIASRSAEPELVYATDEDTTFLAPDPRSNRFDNSANPLEWAKTRAQLVDKRMKTILDWGVDDAESWYFLRQAFGSLMFEKARVLNFVGRYIGGQYFNRSHRGDKDAKPPFVIVDTHKQREAMAFLEESLFTDKFFDVSCDLLNHLAPSRWWHQGSSVTFTMDYPIRQTISVMQWYVLFDRLFPNNLRRIHDAEMKTDGSDKFTASEYIQRLSKSVWAEATNARRLSGGTWTDNKPFVSDVRRSLQREYLGLVEPMVRMKPGVVLSPDLHAMVKHSLQNLAKDLDKVVAAHKADFASQAHLTTCKSRIERMLAPELEEQVPMRRGMMFGQPVAQQN